MSPASPLHRQLIPSHIFAYCHPPLQRVSFHLHHYTLLLHFLSTTIDFMIIDTYNRHLPFTIIFCITIPRIARAEHHPVSNYGLVFGHTFFRQVALVHVSVFWGIKI